MSTWESIESLHDYVYKGDHARTMRDRRNWFLPSEGPTLVCWWVPTGHRPTVEEAQERLDLLRREGPTPEAFTFRVHFPPPGDEGVETPQLTPCEWA